MALAIATNPHSKFVLHAMNLDDGGLRQDCFKS